MSVLVRHPAVRRLVCGIGLLAAGCDAGPVERPASPPGVGASAAAPVADARTGPLYGSIVAADSPASFTTRVVVLMEASAALIDSVRADMVEDDFYVMADDLMWYRATAVEYINDAGLPLIRVDRRRRLTFLVDGVLREYDYAAEAGLDLLVLYEPGRPPVTAHTLEPERATSFFREDTPASAQPHVGGSYVERHTCQSEGCGFGRVVALRQLHAYAAEDQAGTPLFRIDRGDDFETLTSNLHFRRVGGVVLDRAVAVVQDGNSIGWLRPGDTVPVLSYAGEGYYHIWYRGARRVVASFWDDHRRMPRPRDGAGRMVVTPQVDTWVRVRDAAGRVGWILAEPGRDFIDADG